jgi:hypothetical protein
MMPLSPSRLAALGALVVVAGAAAAASAATSAPRYIGVSLRQPASAGLPVEPPLSQFKAVANARVVVPTAWRRQNARASTAIFTLPSASCAYTVTMRVTTAAAPDGSSVDRAVAALPAPGPAYVLDSGQHGGRAFRVVRRKTSGTRVQVDAIWTAVLTRRRDIAPTDNVIWADIRAAALSRPGDECHSGTYRERLGPQLGDALAVAKATLAFVRP